MASKSFVIKFKIASVDSDSFFKNSSKIISPNEPKFSIDLIGTIKNRFVITYLLITIIDEVDRVIYVWGTFVNV